MSEEKLTREEWNSQRQERIEDTQKAFMHCISNGGGDEIERRIEKVLDKKTNELFTNAMWNKARVDVKERSGEIELEKDFEWLRSVRKRFKFLTDRFWWIFATSFILLIYSAFGEGIMQLINGG